jgi:hypothetical protein
MTGVPDVDRIIEWYSREWAWCLSPRLFMYHQVDTTLSIRFWGLI